MSNIKKAKITEVDHKRGTASLDFMGGLSKPVKNVLLPHPYAGLGWGINVGTEVNGMVLTSENANQEAFIIGFLPDEKYFRENSYKNTQQQDLAINNLPKYRELREGEIHLQSKEASQLYFDYLGDVTLGTADGNFINIHKSTDTINTVSVINQTVTEAGFIRNGIVRRDIRKESEKLDDLIIDSLISYDEKQLEPTYIIGTDPVFKESLEHPGLFDPTEGMPNILEHNGKHLRGLNKDWKGAPWKTVPFADKILEKVKNPAVTEFQIEVNEWSDGIASLNLIEQKPEHTIRGWLPPNLLARVTLGTLVDKNGLMPRFDYVFGDKLQQDRKEKKRGKGHNRIWYTTINENNNCTDYKYDNKRTLKDGPIGMNDTFRCEVENLVDKFNASIAFEAIFNSRGNDHRGVCPDDEEIGSRWYMAIDKEGMTKLNIPAASKLGEVHREARSLLANLDGSITLSVGREKGTDFTKKSVVAGHYGTYDKSDAKFNADACWVEGEWPERPGDSSKLFLNVESDRVDHSITFDLDGCVEGRIDAKEKTKEAVMLEINGGICTYIEKFIHSKKSVAIPKNPLLKKPSKNDSRNEYSISSRMTGAVELDIGKSAGDQSMAINAASVCKFAIDSDSKGDSLNIQQVGSFTLDVLDGNHKIEVLSRTTPGISNDSIRLQHGGATQSLIQIDKTGMITLRNTIASAQITIDPLGNIAMTNASGAHLTLTNTGTIEMGMGIMTMGLNPILGALTMQAGSNAFSMTMAGELNIVTSSSISLTSPLINLNSSFLKAGPSPLTPFSIAIGDNVLIRDPISGDITPTMPNTKIG